MKVTSSGCGSTLIKLCCTCWWKLCNNSIRIRLEYVCHMNKLLEKICILLFSCCSRIKHCAGGQGNDIQLICCQPAFQIKLLLGTMFLDNEFAAVKTAKDNEVIENPSAILERYNKQPILRNFYAMLYSVASITMANTGCTDMRFCLQCKSRKKLLIQCK